MSEVFIKYAIENKNKPNILSMYADPDAMENFSAGFVSECTSETVLLNHVTPLGRYDGYAVIRFGNISRIDSGGIYEKRLELLYSNQEVKHPEYFIEGTVGKDTDLFLEVIKLAKKRNLVVNISLDENNVQESIVGFVKKVGSKSAIIDQLTTDGINNGECIFHIADIEKMYCDSEDDRALGILNSLYGKK